MYIYIYMDRYLLFLKLFNLNIYIYYHCPQFEGICVGGMEELPAIGRYPSLSMKINVFLSRVWFWMVFPYISFYTKDRIHVYICG